MTIIGRHPAEPKGRDCQDLIFEEGTLSAIRMVF
jgi:hypothetical protein